MAIHSALKSSGVLAVGSSTLNAAGKPVLVHGYILIAGTAAGSITMKDGTTAGTILLADYMKAQTAAGDLSISCMFPMPLVFTSDCFVTVAGTAATAIVLYTDLS